MDLLPTEIIEKILSNPTLSVRDVLAVSACSKQLKHGVESSNRIWKALYRRSLPSVDDHRIPNNVQWLEETKFLYTTYGRVRMMLRAMIPKYYSTPDLNTSDFHEWVALIRERPSNYSIIVNYLIALVEPKSYPAITEVNLTMRFYARKCVQFLTHFKLKQEYREFVKLDEAEKILEKAAVFVAQWCQPTTKIKYDDIRNQLDYIASQVANELQIRNPRHPYFAVPSEVRQTWYTKNLSANQYNGKACMEIVDAITEILYRTIEFTGNSNEYYLESNSFINRVLKEKKGLPITLSIIHESVARRMGLNCEPMNNPAHFLLRLIPGQSRQEPTLFIDSFHGGQLFLHCPQSQNVLGRESLERATAQIVMSRMAGNLRKAIREAPSQITHLRAVLELSVLLAPDDMNAVYELAQHYISHNIDTSFIDEIFENAAHTPLEYLNFTRRNRNILLQALRESRAHREMEEFTPKPPTPKARREDMLFAVGMIVRHRTYVGNGVITAWSSSCDPGSAQKYHVNVDILKRKDDQPFYYCIFEDGTHRYIPEENLTISVECGSLIDNEEIGRHFSSFQIAYFVPNDEKALEYPEDALARQKYYD